MAQTGRTGHIRVYVWVVCCSLPTVSAADDGKISWATVGVAWVISLLTSLLVVCSALLIQRHARRARKRRNAPPKISRLLSQQSEASDMTRASGQSTAHLLNGGPEYSRVSSHEPPVNRRTTGFLTTWCTEHGLSELIAANLRENGFTSRRQLESLKANDVPTLGLPNIAQQVQLRTVLESLNAHTRDVKQPAPVREEKKSDGDHPAPRARRASSSSDWSRPRSSTTTEEVPLSPRQASMSSSSYSEARGLLYCPGEDSLPSLPSRAQTIAVPGVQHIQGRKMERLHPSQLRFHGLLSDSGLHEVSGQLGLEWRHLAAVLGIAHAQQEQLVHNHPGNVKQQIYDMLRLWRDQERGGKEEVKAVLNKALLNVKRKDLSEMILREQVHGSNEYLNSGQRFNSVV